MKTISIDISSQMPETYRSARVRSLFNVTPDQASTFRASVQIPVDEPGWQIGLIVGPSGSGKSTIGRAAFGDRCFRKSSTFKWSKDRPIIDDIAGDSDFNSVTAALSAVGLGSCPSWLRPFHVLSTGEKFRATLARTLLEGGSRVVMDEFTSVVDRQVAKVGAMAFSKAWRRTPGRQILILSCHRDIVPWVQPDWILDTEDFSFSRGCLQRRPPIEFTIHTCRWSLYDSAFARHHYLDLPHMIAATNYCAVVDGKPVAHVAVATSCGLKSARMCRLVVAPEWQGAGIGLRFMSAVADFWLSGLNRYSIPMTTVFHTSHPGLVSALLRRQDWIYMGGRMGENGLASWLSMSASRQRQGNQRGHSRYGGHMRAVQAFRYVGVAT